ncbi:hypothetical protein [Ruegeria lacuscaerulensis]|uniref:hypothetical protein n=1 Tax=Ruegeria lacuscaerulensis TaxID=55218 RepID=UPI0014817052|nr:hypothetical protein [Ruegeria lacuscaerulensis]
MKSTIRTLLLSVATLGPTASAAQDDAFFLMSGAQIDCIAKNVDSYLSSSEETLFIRPGDCGSERTGETISFMEMTLNAAPDIRIAEEQNIPDEVVVLTREDLACIARQSLPEVASLIAFYPDGCRVVVRAP